MFEVEVRPLVSMAEIKQVESVQRITWSADDLELIPVHLLHALQHNGAALLGAFDGDKLVGFALAILATVDTPERVDQIAAARLKMYSVIAGVLPEYQSHGVGFLLKMAQRDFANHIGVRLITWTYDPLESRNGRFNIGKLGAVCQTYRRDFHGQMGGINAGLATDRFEVEWWVTSNRVETRATRPWRPLTLDSLLGGGAVLVNEALIGANQWPVPPANYVSRPGNLILVEIPADFQGIKKADPDLARRWREHTRDVFEGLFASGFIVTDFVSHTDAGGQRRSYYLLAYQNS